MKDLFVTLEANNGLYNNVLFFFIFKLLQHCYLCYVYVFFWTVFAEAKGKIAVKR